MSQLRSFVERIEAIEAEIAERNADKRDIYAEAKGSGFDVAVLKRVVTERRKDANKRDEADAIFDLYWQALHGTVVAPSRAPAREGRGDVAWQAPREASSAEIKQAFQNGSPISQDFRFENAEIYALSFPFLCRIKVGISNNVAERKSALEAKHGVATLLATCPGNRQGEIAVHEGLAEWRIEGEWFHDEADCRHAIASLFATRAGARGAA